MRGQLLKEFPYFRGDAGEPVFWDLGGSTAPAITTHLDPSADWNGENAGDDADYYKLFGATGREAEVRGRTIRQVGGHLEGAEAFSMLQRALEIRFDIKVNPPRSAVWVFAVMNPSADGGPPQRGDWPSIVGEESPVALPPAKPPKPKPTPPTTQPPPAPGTRSVLYTFDGKHEDITIPAGATAVSFSGTLKMPPTLIRNARYPLTSLREGATEGGRTEAGSVHVGGQGQLSFVGASDGKNKNGGKLPVAESIAYSFSWQAGTGLVKVVAGARKINTRSKVTDMPQGGVLRLGVNAKEGAKDYIPLEDGELSGVLTITGGATLPGPITPPVDPLPPPVDGNLRAMAAEVAAKTGDANSAALALLAAIERSGR